jgi:hypothetical protein
MTIRLYYVLSPYSGYNYLLQFRYDRNLTLYSDNVSLSSLYPFRPANSFTLMISRVVDPIQENQSPRPPWPLCVFDEATPQTSSRALTPRARMPSINSSPHCSRHSHRLFLLLRRRHRLCLCDCEDLTCWDRRHYQRVVCCR